MEAYLQIAANFGLGAFIAIFVLIAYQKLVTKVIDVVQMNAEVMTKLCQSLNSHDRRLESVEKKLDK